MNSLTISHRVPTSYMLIFSSLRAHDAVGLCVSWNYRSPIEYWLARYCSWQRIGSKFTGDGAHANSLSFILSLAGSLPCILSPQVWADRRLVIIRRHDVVGWC